MAILSNAILHLAQITQDMSNADMGQPWAWGPHEEGIRFALIGTCHELRDLAVRLQAQRPFPLTQAQRILGQYHAAYRDLQVLLLGVTEELYNQEPAPGEWPLRLVLGHIVGAERNFFALVHYGLARQRDGEERPIRLPDGEADKVTVPYSEFRTMMETGTMADMLAFYEASHQRVLREALTMTDTEIEGKSLWWENIEYSLRHRLHRFEMHLRQHTIQVEKTLTMLNQPLNEAKQLLRHVFNALAEVETAVLGVTGLGETEQVELAATLIVRAEDVARVVEQAHTMISAVQSGDQTKIDELLAANPKLVNATNQQGITAVLTAAYFGKTDIAQKLAAQVEELFIFEAAALGDLEKVQFWVQDYEPLKDFFNVDGFTPLQLACYFGNEAVALWLIEQGANVNSQAKNNDQIRPIHATAANGNLMILKALLDKGADVNAVQAGDFTALHEAAHSGNLEMTQLLLNYGARKTAVSNGKTPYDIAVEKGFTAVAQLLHI